MGFPGSLTFSVFLGEKREATVQYATRIGREVIKAKKMNVFHPPPTL